jgi:hypothetical protein
MSLKDEVLYWLSGQVISNLSVSIFDAYGQPSQQEAMPALIELGLKVINVTTPTMDAYKIVGPTQASFIQNAVSFTNITFFAVPGAYYIAVWRLDITFTQQPLCESKTIIVSACNTSNPRYLYINSTEEYPGACHESLFCIIHLSFERKLTFDLDVCPSGCSGNGECVSYDMCICKAGYFGLGCEEVESKHYPFYSCLT